MNRCTIIAEAGVNHNGRLDMALELVEIAHKSGADIVKFQTFDTNLLVSDKAEKAEYQKRQTGDGSQLEMLKKLELTKSDYAKIFEHAAALGIKCISTPFDIPSLNFLIGLGMEVIKIPSGEVTNGPFLLEIGRKRLPVILSTGMCNLDEIEKAIAVLFYGYTYPNSTPASFKDCMDLWQQHIAKALPELAKDYIRPLSKLASGSQMRGAYGTADRSVSSIHEDLSTEVTKQLEAEVEFLRRSITILHCTTNYPAAFDEINLNAMYTIRDRFRLPVGYSDHSLGLIVPTIAVSMGATVIEKHITSDKNLSGPDHAASLDPKELATMVKNIREVEAIKGSYDKAPSKSELENSKVARRGLYASKDIAIGEQFSESNITILRPLTNTSPMKFWDIIQTKSTRRYTKGEAL